MHILHIDSSANGAASFSRRGSAALVQTLRAQNGDATVTYRDVAASPPPHIEGAFRASWAVAADQRTPEHVAAITHSEGLIAELKAADVLVIGAPMYNFSVPSTLKTWIDHIAVAGQTFRYAEGRPQGLLTGKRALLALARGGVYSEGPAAAFDHQESYLKAILGFLGITAVEVMRIEGIARGTDAAEASLASAIAKFAAA